MNRDGALHAIYKDSLTLLTDLYELTMAYGYWKRGIADREAVFHLNFRKKPFNGAFALAAGLETALEFLERFHFSSSDLAYLEKLKGDEGSPLFEGAFLEFLSRLRLDVSIDAVPEGTAVFPYEPILRVQGPLLHAQILESPLLNILNFQTLIATKAARISWAARPGSVVEFGMRRAQGIDGALSASRAAFIGGCDATSHVLAGKLFGIPVKGTHAHSWIMAFDEEGDSFDAWSEMMPHNCIFLIDTYDTLRGVKKAIATAEKMRARGCEMGGVRIDSGDLAHLSIEIRRMLDAAGFPKAKIMASNELDELMVSDLKRQGAQINLWGIGTHLVTGKDQAALDGVYKLSAIKNERGEWQNKVKLSEQFVKATNPGILQVRRFRNEQGNCADAIYSLGQEPKEGERLFNPLDPTHYQLLATKVDFSDLLVPAMRSGKRVYPSLPLTQIREEAQKELARFHPEVRRFLYPRPYFVGLSESLYEMKSALIRNLKEGV